MIHSTKLRVFLFWAKCQLGFHYWTYDRMNGITIGKCCLRCGHIKRMR